MDCAAKELNCRLIGNKNRCVLLESESATQVHLVREMIGTF